MQQATLVLDQLITAFAVDIVSTIITCGAAQVPSQHAPVTQQENTRPRNQETTDSDTTGDHEIKEQPNEEPLPPAIPPDVYDNDDVRKVYQIYYKAKNTKASAVQHLLSFGKSVNVRLKWCDVNKFMKNSRRYLDSLLTEQALQNVDVPQKEDAKRNSVQIKVSSSMVDGEYYWVKDLTLQSTVDDICNSLAPRLQESTSKISLYRSRGCKPLPRFESLAQLGLCDGDAISYKLFDTVTGTDYV